MGALGGEERGGVGGCKVSKLIKTFKGLSHPQSYTAPTPDFHPAPGSKLSFGGQRGRGKELEGFISSYGIRMQCGRGMTGGLNMEQNLLKE